MKTIAETPVILFLLVVLLALAGCTSPSTVGLASARQQTLSVSVSIKGAEAPAGVPLVAITTGAMTYDGTRGDVAKNKAASGSSIADDDTITLPLPQSNGTTIARSVWDRIVAKAKADPDETVPAAFPNLSLEKWKELKAAYVECPECLALTPEEEAALRAATGK